MKVKVPAYKSTDPAFYLNEASSRIAAARRGRKMLLGGVSFPLVVIEQIETDKILAKLFIKRAAELRLKLLCDRVKQ